MNRIDRIKNKLQILAPKICTITNNSAMHRDHINAGTESHINITISSKFFDKNTILKNHRIVNALLKDELQNGLHAVSIKIIK